MTKHIPKELNNKLHKFTCRYWAKTASKNLEFTHKLTVEGKSRSTINKEIMIFQRIHNYKYFEELNKITIDYLKRFPEELNENIILEITKTQTDQWNTATEAIIQSLNTEYDNGANLNIIKAMYKRDRESAIRKGIQDLSDELVLMIKEYKRDHSSSSNLVEKVHRIEKNTKVIINKIDKNNQDVIKAISTTHHISNRKIQRLLDWIDEQDENENNKGLIRNLLEIINIEIPIGLNEVNIGKIRISEAIAKFIDSKAKKVDSEKAFEELCQQGLPSEISGEILELE